MLKKLLLSTLSVLILLLSFAPSLAKAEDINPFTGIGPWYNQSLGQFYSKVHDDSNPSEIFGERYTTAQIDWIIWTILMWPITKTIGPEIPICVITGDIGECFKEVVSQDSIQNMNIAQKPAGPQKTLLATIFEDRPLSGVTYFKNVLRRHSIIPEAQAQEGFGFTRALDPVLDMWKAVRDITYGIFVIVVVVLSFMIMFRVKISPQIVISAQSALPKLVVAILLVTFSYAIAGLLVDLMYVVFGIVSVVGRSIFPEGAQPSSVTVFNFITKGGGNAFDLPFGAAALIVLYLVLFTLSFFIVMTTLMGLIFGGLAAFIGGFLLGATFATGLGGLLIILAVILLLVMIVVFGFKIIWMLIKTFVNVLLLTIFAPFQIAIGVLVPSLGFGAWLKNFITNLSVFVVTGTLFLLSFIFLVQGVVLALEDFAGGSIGEFIANFIFGTGLTTLVAGGGSGAWPPLIGLGDTGGSGVGLLFLFVSLGIFLVIPKTADILKALIAGQPFAYGTAIGEAVGQVPKAAWNLGPVREFRRLKEEDYAKDAAAYIAKKGKATGTKKGQEAGYAAERIEKRAARPRGPVV